MFEQVEVNSERWFDLKNLKNEVWKDVIIIKKNKKYEYKDLYKVSNYGRIKSLGIYHGKTNNFFKKEHILKANYNKHGYIMYCLTKFGDIQYFTAHRIVACTFIDNKNEYPQVNHIDGNKSNNNMNNLEWCTSKYNIIHSYKNGLKISKGNSMPKEKNPNSKYTIEQIREIRTKRKFGIKLKDLEKEYGISSGYISQICSNQFWKE